MHPIAAKVGSALSILALEKAADLAKSIVEHRTNLAQLQVRREQMTLEADVHCLQINKNHDQAMSKIETLSKAHTHSLGAMDGQVKLHVGLIKDIDDMIRTCQSVLLEKNLTTDVRISTLEVISNMMSEKRELSVEYNKLCGQPLDLFDQLVQGLSHQHIDLKTVA